MTVVVRTLTDAEERHAAIPALSDLRIRIFRGWPYLYDGTADYEAEYLAEFIREPGSALVVAQDGDAIVGAAKLMHTVIIDECTGCDLCVAPCPVAALSVY